MARARVVPWPGDHDASAGSLVPRHAAAADGVEIDDETVLYDARDGRLHLLNWSAGTVWWAIDGRATTAEIADRLAARFETDACAMRDDVEALLSELGTAGLVVALQRA
jgi:PqqD family protein of HPr-rel-A system